MSVTLKRSLSALLLFALLLSACNTAETPTPAAPTPEPQRTGVPRFEKVDCWFNEPAGEEVECGYLIVPEDHAQPDGPTLKLAVARFSADSATPAPDPIVYLDGGPGSSPLRTMIPQFSLLFGPLLKNRDVILLDQRGTGYSLPALDCPEYNKLVVDTLDKDLTTQQSEELVTTAMLNCRARLEKDGANLAVYNSVQSAADVAALREALNLDQISLYGISYGTRLALTVMRDHPTGIRSVILDSVVPLQGDLYASTVTNGARALNALFDACAADAACQAAYPNLRQVFFDLKAKLAKEPLKFKVDLPDDTRKDFLLNGDTLLGMTFQSLYATSLLPSIPRLIFDLRDGQTAFAAGLQSAFLQQTLKDISNGMHYAVNCDEEVPFSDRAALDAALKANPEFTALGSKGTYTLCAAWDKDPAPASENQAVTSDIPTLILSGGFDPITPPAWGQLAAQTLSRSFFFELPNAGHGASISEECPRDIVRDFLKDPSTKPNGACIIDSMQAIAFATPLRADDIRLVDFDEPLLGLSGKVPDGWQSVAPGTYTPSGKQTDPIALVQQAGPVKPETFLNLLQRQLEQSGLKVTFEVKDTRTANGLDWKIYSTQAAIIAIDMALAEKDGQTYFILMQSPLTDQAVLHEAVFLPAVEALTPAK